MSEHTEQEQCEQCSGNFAHLASLNFYTPVVVDDVAFSIGVYCDKDLQFISANDFFIALDIPRVKVDNTIYHWVNKLGFQEGVDFILKPSNDNIIAKPEYIFTIDAALRIALEIKTIRANAAVEFLESVMDYKEFDIGEFILFDTIVRSTLYPLELVASIMKGGGYNEFYFDEEKLISLLKNDKFLTKALRPHKGHETKFVRLSDQTMVTLHGVQHILRRYAGHDIEEAFMAIANSVMSANRLKSDDLFNAEREQSEGTRQ